ncbi:MAG: hypothetical protein HN361_08780 [Actinobacteria bacterium]|nr:hypothetical protein [Actinomycetota bacterium]MBT7132493.1 hypothetical protein [Actinomycetota bacterium]
MIDISLALPFTLGLVTAVNPCGFAMLPTWLGYFMGNDAADQDARPEQIWRAFTVSLTMASGFVLVFGGLGLAVTYLTSEEAVAQKTPWITVLMGVLFVPYGLALLSGKQIKIPFLRPSRGPGSSEFFSVLGFGMSYAVVSIGCAAPIFLLQVAGSFGRDGVIEGLITYLAFAAGMAAVITALTLSLAMARGGLVRNLRRLLPYMDRLGAGSLVAGGAYLIIYGIYEIRILNDPTTSSNPIVDAVTTLQVHLTVWTTQTGGTQVGLALWLIVLTLLVWGMRPALTASLRKTVTWFTVASWLLAEGLYQRGELIIFPVARLIISWPARMANWANDPWRGATPLEILLSLGTLLVIFSFLKKRR